MPHLAPWASDARRSRGRRIDEPGLAAEQGYRIDRERIVHCTAFRRLVYKTQVFINHEGDLFRTRLTHSLEVAQLARSMARELQLNEDLVEAIALAHDLGHTPFGHAGQDALHDCMRAHGGFEHNLQSLRVVDVLEQCHARFDGLNLSFEAREGILKHCSCVHAERLERDEPGGVLWLRPLVSGAREGRGRLARLDLPDDEPVILVVPDQSLQWQPLAVRAVGVVMVGGGVLSHLGLQLLQARTPTLYGLTPAEAPALEGAWLLLDADSGRLEILSDGGAGAEAERRGAS